MRKLKLLFAACALIIGGGNANAQKANLTTEKGWNQITTLPADLNQYFYALYDGTQDLGMVLKTGANQGSDYKTMWYTANTGPETNKDGLWTVAASGDYQIITCANWPEYMLQTEWNASWFCRTHDNGGGDASWGYITMTCPDGKWTLQNGKYPDAGYVGPWSNVIQDGAEIAANKTGDAVGQFDIFAITRGKYFANVDAASATEASPVDATYLITNSNFTRKTNIGWTFTGSAGNHQYSNTAAETWNSNNVSLTQTIADMPRGLYRLTVQMVSGDAGRVPYLYANGDEEYTANVSQQATDASYGGMQGEIAASADYGLLIVNPHLSADGSLTVGMKAPSGWVVYDNFKLYYLGKTIKSEAVALPDGGAMEADTWYYFDIAAAADNYTATATTLGDIVYTTDGMTLIENEGTITANFAATDNSLTAARYYVKSSTANNLVVGVASYTYTVGTATPSITDGAYIPSLTTIDFTFEASTNDPDGTFALLNNTATATLSAEGSQVATGTLSLSGTTLTATFSNVTLSQNATYTIDIESGVVGYEENETNAAISTTIKTGIIADGVYYFKKKGEYKYLTRGGNYGTETVVDNYGISLQAMIQADGTYYLKNVDHSLSANADKFLNMYTDQGAYAWTIAEATGGYYLKYTDGKYMTTSYVDYTDDNSNTNRYYYQSGTETEGEAIIWELLSKAEYATSLTAKKNAEIAALATAAGISASTLSEFESTLSSDYGETDMTAEIANPLCNSASNWIAVSYNGGSKYTAIDYHAPTIQIYNCVGGITQTIEGLDNGIYKVTVSATWRPGNSAAATRAGNEANTTAWIYANDNITQMKGWFEGGGTINSTQNLVDNAASYLNTVYAYVSDGTLKIGVAVPSFCEQNWCPIYNWTLTRYDAKATDAEKTALTEAIDAAEDNTLGFETGDYAPYNNVAALEALAAAKEINSETASGEAVVAATKALTNATWTANATQMDAIYDGGFANTEVGSVNTTGVTGWSTEDVNNMRQIFSAEKFESGKGLYIWPVTIKYGEIVGYEMPLEANSIYKFTYSFAGQSNTVGGEPTISILSSTSKGLALTGTGTGAPVYTAGVKTYTVYFLTGDTKENYVFTYNAPSGTNTVLGDLSLKKVDALEFADGSVPNYAPGTYPTVKITRTLTADRWATAVYPFAVSGVDNIAVLDSYNAETGALGFSSATASTANVPFLMRSTAAKSEISLSDVEVVAAAATDATANEASLKGVYAATAITNADKNYVLSQNKIYSVGEAGATINPYRAYIQIAQDAPARALTFFVDGEATAIEGVSAESQLNGKVYNLSGQQVEKAQKGIYVVNGKKVVIK